MPSLYFILILCSASATQTCTQKTVRSFCEYLQHIREFWTRKPSFTMCLKDHRDITTDLIFAPTQVRHSCWEGFFFLSRVWMFTGAEINCILMLEIRNLDSVTPNEWGRTSIHGFKSTTSVSIKLYWKVIIWVTWGLYLPCISTWTSRFTNWTIFKSRCFGFLWAGWPNDYRPAVKPCASNLDELIL